MDIVIGISSFNTVNFLTGSIYNSVTYSDERMLLIDNILTLI